MPDTTPQEIAARQERLDDWFRAHPDDAVAGIYYKDRRRLFRKYLQELCEQGYTEGALLRSMKGKRLQSHRTYASVISTPSIFGKGVAVPIIVSGYAYRKLNEQEMFFLLEHHEYLHARDQAYGITLRDGKRIPHMMLVRNSNEGYHRDSVHQKVLDLLFEARAGANEIKHHLSMDGTARYKTLFASTSDGIEALYRSLTDCPTLTAYDHVVRDEALGILSEVLPLLPDFMNRRTSRRR